MTGIIKRYIAVLRKHFYSSPASERRAVGSTVQMQCLPPDGQPRPEVSAAGVHVGEWYVSGTDLLAA
jgi:hypothetical protein